MDFKRMASIGRDPSAVSYPPTNLAVDVETVHDFLKRCGFLEAVIEKVDKIISVGRVGG
jgi:outer membrane protein assembly factor BamA